MKKFLTRLSIIVVIVLLLLGYWRYYRVFGEGTKAGTLNFVVKKGIIFKTFEGSMIQSGFKGSTAGTIQSYEFKFSVVDDSLANVLMTNSGKEFVLHYDEYMGAIPWRGMTPFIVDKIVSMRDLHASGNGLTQ